MVKKLLRSIAVVIWLISGIAGTSFAQVRNASLTGLVSDPSGAVINGASVTIRNRATNVAYIQKTDQSGYYLFPSLPIGPYTAAVEFSGFKRQYRMNRCLK
jgi:Carboxypeptidase regulatory-like domain